MEPSVLKMMTAVGACFYGWFKQPAVAGQRQDKPLAELSMETECHPIEVRIPPSFVVGLRKHTLLLPSSQSTAAFLQQTSAARTLVGVTAAS